MLTVKQQVHYGYRSVHDLPTPPSTSRPSPPLIHQDPVQKPLPAIPRSSSPSSQPMSAPHRGLPPPAAMTLAQPPPPGAVPPPPPPPGPPLGPSGTVSAPASQGQLLGQLPAPPQWQGAEDSMRTWLIAKTEEEKRRQEEEKTRQESLRLEQRRTEHDILRTSLQGGIPPPMVPVVFAGMGGGMLPQVALEWAQQYMHPQNQHPQGPPLIASGHVSPEHQRRDSQAQAYGHYPTSGGVPSTPGSAQGPPGGYVPGYPASPTRPRGQSMPGQAGRQLGPGSNLPSLNTNVPPGLGPSSALPTHPGLASAQQQEAQQSPSIYFHHWQPPTSQASRGGSDQPATPSGDSPRKRKATGPQPAAPPPSSQLRYRSPPFGHSTGLSNPPPGRRRGHARQRSDLGSYRPAGRGRSEGFTPLRGVSPTHATPTTTREGSGAGEGASAASQSSARNATHSVSSLLSDQPPSPPASQYPPGPSDSRQGRQGEVERRGSPRSSEENTRGGVAGSATTHKREND